jgi:hypothetical protein
MGFAWMAEGGRPGFGGSDFYDYYGSRDGSGSQNYRAGQWQAGQRTAGIGRHAQRKSHRPVLRSLGVAGLYPRARTRRDQRGRSVSVRGAHAAGPVRSGATLGLRRVSARP